MKLVNLTGTKEEIKLAETLRLDLINNLNKKIESTKESDYKYILSLERDYLSQDITKAREFISIYQENQLQRERSL